MIPALGLLLPDKLKRIGMVAVLVAFVALASGLTGYCKGRSDGRAAVQLQLERANTRALQEKARADELAAERRLTDTLSINRQEQEMRRAIASTPDSAPDGVRVRLACERLRRSGQDTARIPACR